jgi:hypothetical protein
LVAKAVLQFNYQHIFSDDAEDISVRLQNVGRAIARYPGFVLELANAEIMNVNGSLRDASVVNTVPVVTYDNVAGVIHPNGILVHIGVVRIRRLTPDQAVEVALTLYWEGSQSVNAKIVIPPK